jgi:hypothetical protein
MYEIDYETGLGWCVKKNGVMVGYCYHRTEWQAIDELAEIDPAAGAEMARLHASVQ